MASVGLCCALLPVILTGAAWLVLTVPFLQSQIVFLHALSWPPVNFSTPHLAYPAALAGWPRTMDALHLFPGLVGATAHRVDDRLGVWRVPRSSSCSKEHPPVTALYMHGNGESRGFAHRKLRVLGAPPFCATVFTFDYSGFGDSAGQPSERALVDDAARVWSWIGHLTTVELGPEATQQHAGLLYGHSLGGAVALALAARLASDESKAAAGGVPFRALVLDSTFTNITDVAASKLSWLGGSLRPRARQLINENAATHFDSRESAKALCRCAARAHPAAGITTEDEAPTACPAVLVVHGTDDWVVPLALGRQLFGRLVTALDVALKNEEKKPLQKFTRGRPKEQPLRLCGGARFELVARRGVLSDARRALSTGTTRGCRSSGQWQRARGTKTRLTTRACGKR